ncbi:methylated-DNA--[protein]-cysteine S-methyltransferase [Mesorhizobium kowhaii]|uniref:methylated-DNA--[protein]-cysteine S-methyltransferase n=1 Tax=Mesorhizobium kowhaii TaxID=1300272 RepID=UPI0035E828C0
MNLMQTQMTAPTAIARNAAALDTIAYAIGESAIGNILAARSRIGVCAILIGSDADTLEQDLGNRFPGRMRIEDEAALRDDLAAIARFIETPSVGLDLPLDMRHGTPFQQRVWDVLRAIPCGATITYTALARRLGQPNGARAVATACAANAIALGIPCHRVVRADGTLAGYRWGVERKRALLDKEATL